MEHVPWRFEVSQVLWGFEGHELMPDAVEI